MPGGSGGGSGQVIQRQVNDVPSYLEGDVKKIASQARNLYDKGQGPQFYPGETYIPPTEQELAGLNNMEAMARTGTGLGQSLLSNIGGPLQDIISGKNAISVVQPGEANPYLKGVLDTSAKETAGLVNSSVGGLGRYGSPENTQVLSREVGDLYQRGLSNQMNADLDRRAQAQAANIANQAGAINQQAQLSPIADQMLYSDPQRLINIGAAQRGEAQSQLQQNIARYNATQQRPWDQLNLYSNAINGLTPTGGVSTTYQPQGSPIAGILGGALSGGGLLGWPGAIGGGLLGLFS